MTIISIYSDGYVPPERYETEPNTSSVYRYFLADLITGAMIAEVPLNGVTWSLGVSRPGEFSGTIPVAGFDVVPGLDLYAASLPLKTALFVMRNEETVWGGIVVSRAYSVTGRTLSLNAAGFEYYLFRRYIWSTLTYTNLIDQYQVVRNLIDAMQSDFELTSSAADRITPVPFAANINIECDVRDAKKFQRRQTWNGGELKSFGDALTEFANNEFGFEWNIRCWWDGNLGVFRKKLYFRDTPPGQWPTGIPYTYDRPGFDTNIFEYPGSIVDVSLEEAGDSTSTRFIEVGGTAAEASEASEGFKPRGYWNNNYYLGQGWGLFEVVDSSSHPGTSDLASLDKYAQIYGRQTRPVVPTWTVVVNGRTDPTLGSYVVGDWCQIMVEDEFIRARLAQESGDGIPGLESSDYIKRIMGYSVSVPDVPQEPETVTLELMDEWVDPQ